ncbi:hypothetical protein [Spirosoma koreense]
MKLIVGLLVLVFIAQSECRAQSAYSKPDTIQAIHRLFGAKRTASRTYLGIGLSASLVGAGTAFLATTLVSTIRSGAEKNTVVPTLIAGAGIGLVPAGIGLVRRIRYSRKREREILRQYEAGEPLPRWILRRLTPRFVHS